MVIRQDVQVAIAKDNTSLLAIPDTATEDKNSKAIEDFALDETLQGSGTISWRVTRLPEVILDFIGAVDFDIAAVVLEAFLDLVETEVDDLADLLPGETIENDGAGDTVEEFRQEVVAECAHDHLAGLRVD